jgi:hypothetical protein
MKKKLIFSALFLLTSVFAFAQSADEIVNKYIDAMGGKDKIANVKTLKMVATVDIGPNMKAPMTLFVVNNKSFRMDMEIQGMKMVQAYDGESGWYIQPWGGKKDAEKMNEEMVRDSKDQADINGSLYDYKVKGNTVEYLGKEDMEGTDTYKLKVTKKSGDIEYVFLDASSYLKLKETSKHKFQDKEVEGETIYSNWKKVDGIMFPFTIEQREKDASQGQAMNFDSYEVNPKVDEAMFKMPPPTAAAAPSTDKK